MPSTLKEISDLCGVTKQTVKNNLRAMGLWDFHVTQGDTRTPAVVDDEATRQVVAVITARRRSRTEAPEAQDADERAQLLREQVAQLQERVVDQARELDRLRAQNDRLAGQVVEQAGTIKALPSPDAVERAREDGERAGRVAGEAAGREDERQRIADMGFMARRRYLRGSRGL
jgi:hypothetical protein